VRPNKPELIDRSPSSLKIGEPEEKQNTLDLGIQEGSVEIEEDLHTSQPGAFQVFGLNGSSTTIISMANSIQNLSVGNIATDGFTSEPIIRSC